MIISRQVSNSIILAMIKYNNRQINKKDKA